MSRTVTHEHDAFAGWCRTEVLTVRLLALLSVLCLPASAAWITTSIDTLTHTRSRKWTTMQSLDCDTSGTLHAVWVEMDQPSSPKRVLYSLKRPHSPWTVPDTVADSVSSQVSLAVTADGRAHIAYVYQFTDTNDLGYATNRTGPWVCTRLTKDSVYDVSPSIGLEHDTIPHIAWITREPGVAFRIGYATNRAGPWVAQLLRGSQLGPFGLGAAPCLAVSPAGRAHATYRGGDYGDYHIHHAQNSGPGDTAWTYEILTTLNINDFSSAIAAHEDDELFLVCSGNDYWGAPFRTHYLHRPASSSTWDPYELMTGSTSASMEGFCMDGRHVHATWQVISGNIMMEMIYHVTNASGQWFNSPIRADTHTTGGAIVVDREHRGHALVTIETAADTELYCIHSAPLVGVEEAGDLPSSPRLRMRSVGRGPVRIELPEGHAAAAVPGQQVSVQVHASDGRLIRTVTALDRVATWDARDSRGRLVPCGAYVLRCGRLLGRTLIVR